MSTVSRHVVASVVSAVTTTATRGALGRAVPGGAGRWTRTNHRGEPISLLEGPALALGLLGGIAAGGRTRRTAALALATGASAVFGAIDDLAEDTSSRSKGLRGHLAAARDGRLTTGGLKVLGIGATGLAAAALLADRDVSPLRRALDIMTDGALVAASANLVNLLDLRPGRALKVGALTATTLVASGRGTGADAVLGATVAAWPGDLGERDMLGDCGANALGALLGTATVAGATRPVRAAALSVVVALTLVSERVSFSQVISRTPWLDALDMLGRRPAGPIDPAAGSEPA